MIGHWSRSRLQLEPWDWHPPAEPEQLDSVEQRLRDKDRRAAFWKSVAGTATVVTVVVFAALLFTAPPRTSLADPLAPEQPFCSVARTPDAGTFTECAVLTPLGGTANAPLQK
jgi:hypothetical protein